MIQQGHTLGHSGRPTHYSSKDAWAFATALVRPISPSTARRHRAVVLLHKVAVVSATRLGECRRGHIGGAGELQWSL